MCLFLAGGLIMGTMIGATIQYSIEVLGTPWPPIAFVFLVLCAVACYSVAQIDVEREKREMDRVLDKLSQE